MPAPESITSTRSTEFVTAALLLLLLLLVVGAFAAEFMGADGGSLLVARIVTCPSAGVNLIAFVSRFRST